MKRLATVLMLCVSMSAAAQNAEICLDLQQAIEVAHDQSLTALLARHSFLVSYWQYRTYTAQYLPSLSLNGDLGRYNRSIVQLQNYETGEMTYANNNNLQNSLSLSLKQNLALTGGTLSVNTYLNRLDQYSPLRSTTYNSNPVNISYSQPLNSYNSLKWDRKIEPKRYELAKKQYIESMLGISRTVVELFFGLINAQNAVDIARESKSNTDTMYEIAKKRFAIGAISKDELLQLELRTYNDSISIKDNELSARMAMQRLRNYLGFNETVDIVPIIPDARPDVQLSIDDVFDKMQQNSPDFINAQISSLSAEQEVARAKANTGLTASFYAQFGLNQVGAEAKEAYRNPLDQEIFGISFSVPIVDWGLGAGRVKIARSQQQVTEANIQQTINGIREDVTYKVLQFNLQGGQCDVSEKASEISQQRYESAKERFVSGSVNVTELNNAQSEMNSSKNRYFQDLCNYWVYYYNIQEMTLYDYINGCNVEEDFDVLVKHKK